MKRFLKIILIILIVLITLFLIHTIRNYIIITNLENRLAENKDSVNYYSKQTRIDHKNDTTVVTEYYKKDNNEALFITNHAGSGTVKLSMYKDESGMTMFTETSDTKVVDVTEDGFMIIQIYNYLETDTLFLKILSSMNSIITSTEYDGKDVYAVKRFMSSDFLLSEGAQIYVEKDTGTLVQVVEENVYTRYEYVFDNVDETIFERPDLNEYQMRP